MTLRRAAALAVAVLAGIVAASIASAQETSIAGMKVEGDVAAGGRAFINEPDKTRKGKLEEYRDLGNGALLEQLNLRLLSPDTTYATEIGGRNWGRQDQEFFLRSGRVGLWGLEFDWNEIPHIFSTTGRSLLTETSDGRNPVLTLPTPRPLLTTYNNAPLLDPIGVRWDVGHVGLWLSPLPELDLRVDYTRIHKEGTKVASIAWGSPGSIFAEFAAPVDQTIDDLRLHGVWARDRWQLQLTYQFSSFRNDVNSLTVDNQCFGLTALVTAGGCNTSATAGDAVNAQASGRLSQDPSNHAHTISLAGGVNFPLRTRVTVNGSTSLQYQNQNFLPVTNNPSIFNNPANSANLALPQNSLNGFVQTTLANITVTSRPIAPLTLTAKYRYFDYDDKTEVKLGNAFLLGILNDRCSTAACLVTVAGEEIPERLSYTRHNADADARLRLIESVAFTVGGGWERWNRGEEREVRKSDEYFAKAAVDVTPFDWVSARVTYRPSFRRFHDYETLSDSPTGQNPLLRKYDEAERNRQRVDLLLQFMPVDTFTATATMGYRDDDYFKSAMGLQKETSWSAGIDFSWTPIDRVAFALGYVREENDQTMRSRNRDTFTPAGATSAIPTDFSDFDWVSKMADTVDTFHASVTTVIIPKLLDFSLGGSYSIALGRVDTFNPTPPLLHPEIGANAAADQANATARTQPAFQDQLLRIDAALRYHFTRPWTATLGYVFESFQKHDWRTDQLNPYVGLTSIFLGNNSKNYTAHILGGTLAYHFGK